MTKILEAIVAGAGIWKCTTARCLAVIGKIILVLVKLKAAGENCRYRTIGDIEAHLYGPHIFHTNKAVLEVEV